MPDKANGITEIIKAVDRSINKIKPDKLFDYLEKFDSQSVYKRLGFILQNLGGLNKLGIRDTQIEKDYVIGWVLNGISNNEYLRERLIFKGGTALRKIYFHDYRLSEDLDFTFNGEGY